MTEGMTAATSGRGLLHLDMVGILLGSRYRAEMRTVWLVLVLVCAAAASATAKPLALEPHDLGAIAVQTPVGWTFSADPAKGMAVAQQDPKRKDAAQLLVVVSPNTATEDQLLDAITGQVVQGLKVVRRSAGPGGAGKLLVADGVVDHIKVRLGAIAIVANGGAVVGLLIAKVGEFDGLGGTDLVVSVMASLKASASAPPAEPAAPAPAAVSDRVMQPQYDHYGTLIVPPPTRAIGVADLAGAWQRNDGVTQSYYSTSTGNYAGYSAVAIDEGWIIDGKGGFQEKFKGAVVSSSGARSINANNTGNVSIDRDGTLIIARAGMQAERYIIRGWFVGEHMIVMKLNGPYFDAIAPKDLANPSLNLYKNHDYVRRY